VAILGAAAPVLTAREVSRQGHSPVGGASVAEIFVLIVCSVIAAVLGQRARRSAPEIQG
jgi:hypothetical protein